LVYPDFNTPFIIHTDASHLQLGAVISQDNEPIAFYSWKLNSAQIQYTTTEPELLSIIETLKEFCNILLGQCLKVDTDHKNLTYTNFDNEWVMRWHLKIEEYLPKLTYLKGQTNIVANALSRLELATPEISKEDMHDMHYLANNFGLKDNNLPEDAYPLQYKLIAKHQNQQKELFTKLCKQQDGFHLKSFCGGGKTQSLICRNEKNVLPKMLQCGVITWYNDILCHCGETRTEQMLRWQFWWPNLHNDVHKVCSKCNICQQTKCTTKEAEASPWEVLCVDLIGPYTIKCQGKKNLVLWCITMIGPATGWVEMQEIPNKEAFTIANFVKQTWLTRYPWPNQIIFD
jgi:RNase H-like domain found in reverse transcriptase/Integrase zinc binding domain